MDNVDLAILDEITSSRAIIFGGLDPRRSPESIAKRLGLNASTIRARMNHWRESGFLVNWHILPNPTVLGMHHYAGYVAAAQPNERRAVLEAIKLTDGMVACFEHIGGLVGMGLYAPNESDAQRRYQLIANLPGVRTVSPIGPIQISHASGAWKPKDWQLLHALRQNPDAAIQELAAATGTSRNTTARRLTHLAESNGLWNVAELDFRKFKGTLVRVLTDFDSGTPRDVYDAIGQISNTCFYRDISGNGRNRSHALVRLDSPAEQDDLEEQILGLPNVTGVQFVTPRRFKPLTATVDSMLPALPA